MYFSCSSFSWRSSGLRKANLRGSCSQYRLQQPIATACFWPFSAFRDRLKTTHSSRSAPLDSGQKGLSFCPRKAWQEMRRWFFYVQLQHPYESISASQSEVAHRYFMAERYYDSRSRRRAQYSFSGSFWAPSSAILNASGSSPIFK